MPTLEPVTGLLEIALQLLQRCYWLWQYDLGRACRRTYKSTPFSQSIPSNPVECSGEYFNKRKWSEVNYTKHFVTTSGVSRAKLASICTRCECAHEATEEILCSTVELHGPTGLCACVPVIIGYKLGIARKNTENARNPATICDV